MKISRQFLFIFIAMLVLTLGTAACEGGVSQETQTTELVDQQQSWYLKYQPPPFYTWSLERAVAIQLYDNRNSARSTYTYSFAMTGQILFSCPSKGFPLPYGVQLTNSERLAYNDYRDSAVLPQAEPNGLYTNGATTQATWYLCARKLGIAAVYSEPEVMAFPFAVKEVDGRLVDIEDQPSSFNIDLTRPADIPTTPPSGNTPSSDVINK